MAMTGMCRTVVALVPTLLSVACSPRPQVHPTETAPVPANVRISEECSTLGRLMCGAVSMLSGDGGVERRSACFAYTEQSGRRVEQCGSISASQMSSLNVPNNHRNRRRQPVSPGKTIVTAKMVLGFIDSSAIKYRKWLNWDRTRRI
jgi:hypothetical protein